MHEKIRQKFRTDFQFNNLNFKLANHMYVCMYNVHIKEEPSLMNKKSERILPEMTW